MDKLTAISAALTGAAPALAGRICANCDFFRKGAGGRLYCAAKDGPRNMEQVKPADSCAAYFSVDDGKVARDRAIDGTMTVEKVLKPRAAKISTEAARDPSGTSAERLPYGGSPARPKVYLKPLPKDCPVVPLGKLGDQYFYIDSMRQFYQLAAKDHGRLHITHMFGGNVDYLSAWCPAMSKGGAVSGPAYESAAASLMRACDRFFDPRDKLRGRGLWHAAGDGGAARLVAHLGHAVLIDGAELPPGLIGEHVYPAASSLMRPKRKVSDAGRQILAILQRWRWKRKDIDPLLMLGWIVCGFLGASLRWRPMIFVSGNAGCGKSTLNRFVELLMGGWLLWANDATPAGVTSELKIDCVPVAIDENEAKPDSRRAQDMIELARLAASGGTKRRGSSNHEAHQFTLRSAMMFSAVNPPAMEPQDKSRFALLRLQKLEQDAAELDLDTMDLLPLGQSLLADILDRTADAGFATRHRDVAKVLKDAGHDQRGRDTFGTLLTAAWLALGDEAGAMDLTLAANRTRLQGLMEARQLDETADRKDNWRKCLDLIMGLPVEVFRGRPHQTIGQIIEAVNICRDKGPDAEGALPFEKARQELKAAGVLLLKPDGWNSELEVFIPNDSPQLAVVMKATEYRGIAGEGGWKIALEQAPPETFRRDRQRLGLVKRGLTFGSRVALNEDDETADGMTEGRTDGRNANGLTADDIDALIPM